MIPVDVIGIRLELPSNQPVLILRDQELPRYLPLWIGDNEAKAINLLLSQTRSSRPLTHELLANVVTALGEKVISVTITELIEGTFYATVNFANHDSISARPSDAVALALQSGAPVLVSSEVMDTAALDVIDDEDEESDEAEEVEKFRAFLDEINPEDFS